MKFAAIISTLVPAFASAALTYNVTQALAPGEFNKYHCLTTAKWNKLMPDCIKQCQIQANKADGCAYDDFGRPDCVNDNYPFDGLTYAAACHSVNYQVFSDIVGTPLSAKLK
ncbi:hypothetical protein LTR53_008721 [Teratosphaeriaceae sp. CCFEE 6253]|nr:hypothetical protein LTR53_008721 [Teratosphaeriaceae sp. CCFEE 6253]